MTAPHFLTADCLHSPRLSHGFFTRQGGVCPPLQDHRAQGLSAGFSAQANPKDILENRRRIEGVFGLPFVTAQQVHGAKVLFVDAPWDPLNQPREADGLVTNQPGLGLGILTADCGPVLLADLRAGVIGACHVGWRGLRAGVIEASLNAMIALGAMRSHICAALGPCIGPLSYEVDLDFPDHFSGVLADHRSFFTPSLQQGKLLFDLPRAISAALGASGIRQPEILPYDTFTQTHDFFSYRRAQYERQADYGRQISLIALK